MIVGSGIDVIEIARIQAVMDRRGERFLERVYTPAEIERCLRAGRAAPHFALRFAAKEAAMKALGTGWAQGVRWVDLETRPPADALGADGGGISEPLDMVLHGESQALAQRRCRGEAVRAMLGLGRSRTHAMAVVMLESVPS